MTIVEVRADGTIGLGYTYEPRAARLVRASLADLVCGQDALALATIHGRMVEAVRRLDPELAAAAIAAVDIALWDLKARLLGVPLASLLGAEREQVVLCPCAGFTSLRPDTLAGEVAEYAVRGHRRIAIAIDPIHAIERVDIARDAAGPDVELVVDGRGTFGADSALAVADTIASHGVTCFVDPVPHDDIDNLHWLRTRSPLAIASGRACVDPVGLARLLEAGAVDVLLVDATRCRGITGFLEADALAAVHGIPIASFGAPAVHAHAGPASSRHLHLSAPTEQARFEALLFDHLATVRKGSVMFDAGRAGLGIELRRDEIQCMAA
ncbi:MAG: mandelate racemase [Kofleriaceae bacterium]|nr:mandelate racemase [Kofleriaceae bacterium]